MSAGVTVFLCANIISLPHATILLVLMLHNFHINVHNQSRMQA